MNAMNINERIDRLKHDIPLSDKFDFDKVFSLINETTKNMDILKELIQLYDNTGFNLLMWLCRKVRTDDTLYLIETFGSQCRPEQVNQYGETALMWACKKNMESVVLKLIETFGTQCRPEQINIYDDTAFMLTCENKMESTALKLIETFGAQCRPEQVNIFGNIALNAACSNNMKSVALKLIDDFWYLYDIETLHLRIDNYILKKICIERYHQCRRFHGTDGLRKILIQSGVSYCLSLLDVIEDS